MFVKKGTASTDMPSSESFGQNELNDKLSLILKQKQEKEGGDPNNKSKE